MAQKFECVIPGCYDFDEVLNYFHEHLLGRGVLTDLTGGSDYRDGAIRVAVRVYERFAIIGTEWFSLTVTMISNGQELFLSAVAAGGGGEGAFGESRFVNQLIRAAEQFEGMEPVQTFSL